MEFTVALDKAQTGGGTYLSVLGRRNSGVRVTVLPAAVQGEQAPEAIVRQIEAANAYTSDQSGEMLAGLIARGATRAVRDDASPDRLRSADDDIRRFARRMIQEGRKDADGSLRLGETSFGAARGTICPIYPFC